MTTEYACVGRTEFGGRCRNMVTAENPVCQEHTGEQIRLAPSPTRILVKFFTRRVWAERNLPNTPVVRRTNQRTRELDEAHRQLSEKLGVDHFAYRQKGDTGTPVFGRQGAGPVSLRFLQDELEEAGLFLQGLHVEIREATPDKATIILEYDRQMPSRMLLPDATGRSKLLGGKWRVHVWVNPPAEDGTVVHTVNCTFPPGAREKPQYLVYNNGLWGTA